MSDCNEETIKKVALSMMRGVTSVLLKVMLGRGMDWHDIFGSKLSELSASIGLNEPLQESDRDEALASARREVEFMERHSIRCLFLLDEDYPWRLFEIPDSPVVLYVLGDADLDMAKMVSLVGTRTPTPWGIAATSGLVEGLGERFDDVCVVSGLAYGIDAAAHTACLKAGVPTIAVLAHGLQMIYPAAHRDLARRILHSGGALVSEYPYGTTPYRGRFLERNRIVAGLSDVTAVMECDVRSGALSTARCAEEYNRDVMAVPGRPSDKMSAGCNNLIFKNKATMLRDVSDLLAQTGWTPEIYIKEDSRTLFPEISGENKIIYDHLAGSPGPCALDDLCRALGIPMSQLQAALTELEFDDVVTRHPGNRFSVVR